MIKTFSHKGLNNFFNNEDTTKLQSDHIKKLKLLLANLNASTNIENFSNTSPEYWLNLQQQYDIWNAKKAIDVSHIKILLRKSA